MDEKWLAGELPVLALRGLTVFPDQTVHFDIGRPKSIKALEAAMKGDQLILLIPQKDILEDDPALSGLYQIGTVAKVKQVLKNQGENLRALVTGICRARIVEVTGTEPHMSALAEAVASQTAPESTRNQALRRDATMLYGLYCELMEHPAQAVQLRILASNDPGFIADAIAQNSGIDYPQKAQLLCQLNPIKRLETAIKLLHHEMEMLHIEADIQAKTHKSLDKNQREYYLREQMRIIREELGEGDELSEFEDYQKKILSLHLEEDVQKKLLKDVSRLKKQPFGSADIFNFSYIKNFAHFIYSPIKIFLFNLPFSFINKGILSSGASHFTSCFPSNASPVHTFIHLCLLSGKYTYSEYLFSCTIGWTKRSLPNIYSQSISQDILSFGKS